MRRRSLVFVALLLVLPSPVLRAQQVRDTAAERIHRLLPVNYRPLSSADTATRDVRRLFFQRDFHSAQTAGPPATGDPSAVAWRALSLQYTGAYSDALAVVDSMARAWPKSRWTHFARAAVLVDDPLAQAEALRQARLARASAPWDPDMIWVNTLVLNRRPDAALDLALLDSAQSRGVVTAELLVRRAEGLEGLTFGLHPDTTALERALATLQEALRLDSLNVNAWALTGDLRSRRQSQDSAALPVYRRALEVAPLSIPAHKDYWSSVLSQRYLSPEDKRREVERDLAWLRAHRPDGPAELDATAEAFRRLKDWARSRPAEEELVRRFPASDAAERTARTWIDGLRAPYRGQPLPDSVRPKVLAGFRAFVDRPYHHSMFRLGSTYLDWYLLISGDSTASPAELARVVRGLWRYEHLNAHILAGTPVLLADRGVALELADSLARLIPGRSRVQLEESKRYSDPAGYALALQRLDADMYDALGWVHFKQGRVAAARKELRKAIDITPKHDQALWHLGQLEEQRGDPAAAEQAYARGVAAERARGPRRNEEALKRLFARRHGSLDGYDVFLAGIQEKERAERRAKVLAGRLKQPAPMPAFRLARLEGGTFASDSARGRIVVVNFWGTWCGPCIAELPQIQKVAERYAHDPDVVFLTIANDEDPQVVRDFVAKRQLQLPVLLDDGFVARAHINSWPTTWFVGRDGRIAFEQRGGSNADGLSEEFVWKIEELKGEK